MFFPHFIYRVKIKNSDIARIALHLRRTQNAELGDEIWGDSYSMMGDG